MSFTQAFLASLVFFSSPGVFAISLPKLIQSVECVATPQSELNTQIESLRLQAEGLPFLGTRFFLKGVTRGAAVESVSIDCVESRRFNTHDTLYICSNASLVQNQISLNSELTILHGSDSQQVVEQKVQQYKSEGQPIEVLCYGSFRRVR